LPVDCHIEEYDDLFHTKMLVKEASQSMQTVVKLNIPKIDNKGMFSVNGISRQLCYTLNPMPIFNNRCMNINHTYLSTPYELLLKFIKQAYATQLSDFFMFGHQEDSTTAQMKLDNLLKTSRLSHVVKGIATHYGPKISLELFQERTDEFMPFNTEGILDWTSISQSSGNCGRTMYMAEECKINDIGCFTKRGRVYCDILNKNLIVPEYNRRRTTASNFKASSKLVSPDKPMVFPEDYDNNLNGKHLLTVHAIMPGVYKEQIVMSKSAARKMTCVIPEKQTFVVPGWCKQSLKMEAKAGDIVRPNQIIGSYSDGEETITLKCHVKREAKLSNISEIRTKVANTVCTKLIVEYERFHILRSGDKITNRHGNKGIVNIIPDEQMPKIDGKPAEVVTNALATLKRRNPGQIVEAMLNNIAEESGPAPVPHFLEGEDGNIPSALIKECKPQKHTYNGQTVEAWSGKVFWIVLDKFSHQTNTHACSRKLSDDGIYANSGKRSGTRIYITVMQLMLSKGWDKLLYRLIDEYATGSDRIQKYLFCLIN